MAPAAWLTATARGVHAAARHPLTKNFSLLALGNLGSRALLFLVNVHLARVLSPEYFGKVVFAQTILLFGTVVSDLGTRTVKVRDVATREPFDRQDADASWGTMWSLAVPALILMVLAAAVVGRADATEGLLVLLFALALPAYGFNLDWLLKGRQRFGPVGVAETLKAVVYLGLVLILLRSPDDVLLVPVAYAVGWGVAAAYLAVMVRGHGVLPRPRLNAAAVKRLVAAGLPIGITGLLSQAYLNGGIVFLKVLADSAAVGLYAAAFKLTLLVALMGALFSETMLPALSRTYAASPARARRLLVRVLALLAGASALMALGIALLSEQILQLVYGGEYRDATPVLMVLALALVPLLCNVPFVNLLIVKGRQRLLLVGGAVGCLMNVVGNLTLIPRYGPLGAAWTELGTETVVAATFAALAVLSPRAVSAQPK